MDSNYKELKRECYDANMRLNASGLVFQTFGNVSSVDRDKGVFAIKPSGIPYANLTPEDMVVLDYDTTVIGGKKRPSSDSPTHAYLYKHWSDIGGVAHTHATYSVAWAQAQRDIPILGTTHADHLTFDIPCAPPMDDSLIEGRYEHNTGVQILDCFKEKKIAHEEIQMILVSNHGPFTWGKSAAEAVYNSEVLEAIAQMAYLALQINPTAPRLKEALIKKHYDRKHGKDAYYGQ